MSVTFRFRQAVPNSTTLYAPSPMSLMGLSGSHRRITFTSCLVHSGTVLCRRPKVVSTSSEVSNTLRKGRAKGRLVHGGVTRSIRHSHFKPRLILLCFSDE